MKRTKNIIDTLITLFIAFSIFLGYTLIHEGSHAVFAIIFGCKIIAFDINILSGTPHVSYTGDLTAIKSAIISIAGFNVPFIMWLMLLIINRNNKKILVKKILLFSSFGILSTAIINIVLPILFKNGYNVQGEDIVKFIIYTGLNSYLVSLIALMLFILGGYVLLTTINVKEVIRAKFNLNISTKKHYIWVIPAIVCFSLILITSSMNVLNVFNNNTNKNIPKNYDHLIHIDLSEKDYSNSTIYEFEVKEPKLYSFYSLGKSKESISLKLISDNNLNGIRKNEMVLVNGKGAIQSNYTNFYFEKGRYSLIVSSSDNKGKIDTYITSEDLPNDFDIYTNNEIMNGDIPKQDEFELIAKEELSSYDEKTVCNFTLDKTTTVQFSIFATTDMGEAVIKLKGNNYEDILLSEYQVYTEGRGCTLKSGAYELIVSSNNCNGSLYIYMKK